jgi:hypothetical protein
MKHGRMAAMMLAAVMTMTLFAHAGRPVYAESGLDVLPAAMSTESEWPASIEPDVDEGNVSGSVDEEENAADGSDVAEPEAIGTESSAAAAMTSETADAEEGATEAATSETVGKESSAAAAMTSETADAEEGATEAVTSETVGKESSAAAATTSETAGAEEGATEAATSDTVGKESSAAVATEKLMRQSEAVALSAADSGEDSLNNTEIKAEQQFKEKGITVSVTVQPDSVPEGSRIQISSMDSTMQGIENFSVQLRDPQNKEMPLPEGKKIHIEFNVDRSATVLKGASDIDSVSAYATKDPSKFLQSSDLEPSVMIGFDAAETGGYSLKLVKCFRRPQIVFYGFPQKGQRVPVMISYFWGPDIDHLDARGSMPDDVIPGLTVPIELARVNEIQLDHEDPNAHNYYNSPYHQDYFQQIRFRYTAGEDGTISVEKISGAGGVEYDRFSNTIKVYLESAKLTLNTPRLVNTYYNNMGTGHEPYDSYWAHYFTFTPETDGEYNYFSSDNSDGADPRGAVLDSNGKVLSEDQDSGGNKNFSISRIRLKKGETYYFGTMLGSNYEKHGDYKITITKEEPPEPLSFTDMAEGYVDLHVDKTWESESGDETHDPIKVTLVANSVDTKELTLSEDNNWGGTFANLPLYDDEGKEISYSVKEEDVLGYDVTYGDPEETSRRDYWVMVNAPGDLKKGRKYVIAAQDWGQAMYYNNPHTYYFLQTSDAGEGGNIELHRIDHTDKVFIGPKTGDDSDVIVLGEKEYDEYLNPDSDVTKNLKASEMWRLGTEGDGKVLQNIAAENMMTLKGENQWWNIWNPHVYSYINTNDDGWHSDTNVNYSHILDISGTNDGMARISSAQYWGNNQTETQYLYLNLSAYAQTTGATGDYNSAGQFKFFTPITKVEKTVKLTNTEKTSIHIRKKWVDSDNHDGIRPTAQEYASKVHLMKGEEDIEGTAPTVTDNGDGTYTVTFSNLPKTTGSKVIDYYVREDDVAGYEADKKTAGDGETITNTRTPGKTSLSVSKIWDDNNDQDGKRPDRVVLHLLADGTDTGRTLELTEATQWGGSFTDLDELTGGRKIRYTLREDAVAGYSMTITGSDSTGFTVTNIRTPDVPVEPNRPDTPDEPGTPDKPNEPDEPVIPDQPDQPQEDEAGGVGSVSLYKVDAQTGEYLAGAEFALYRSDGMYIGTYTTDSHGYLNVQNLPYSSYYFKETKAPENYVANPGYIRFVLDAAHSAGNEYPWNIKVTNTKPGVPIVVIGGTKTWDDNNNAKGIRPETITLHLLANGIEIASTQTSAELSWNYSFGTQPLYDAEGKSISYTVTEDAVAGYEFSLDAPVAGNGTIVFNVKNTLSKTPVENDNKVETPKGNNPKTEHPTVTRNAATGDNSNMMLYLILMIASVTALVTYLIIMKKRKETE